jgi:hypothetical protein
MLCCFWAICIGAAGAAACAWGRPQAPVDSWLPLRLMLLRVRLGGRVPGAAGGAAEGFCWPAGLVGMLGGRALLLPMADPPPLVLSDPAAEPLPLIRAPGVAGVAPPALLLRGFAAAGVVAEACTSTPLLLWRPKA